MKPPILARLPNFKMVVQAAFCPNPPHILLKACPDGSEPCVAVPVEKLPGLWTPGPLHLAAPGPLHLAGILHLGAHSLLPLDAPGRLHLGTPCLFYPHPSERLLLGPTLLLLCQCASLLTNWRLCFFSCLFSCLSSQSGPIWSFCSCPNWR